MRVQWQGRTGGENEGHEIEFGTAPHPNEPRAGEGYYFSLCGERADDPAFFRVWVYCYKGCRHIGPKDGFGSIEEAKAFVSEWLDDTEV